MTTPIADFVKKYAQKDVSRFHMPGHKGASLLGCEALDITEINGADVLGSASGIIAESENNAAELFGSRYSFYSTEGSSLAIKAMLALIKKKTPSGKRTRILAARNVHKAFIYACALLDIDAQWLYPKEFSHLCSCKITAEELEKALVASVSLPDAVYVTSPDYLGNIADIKGLSEVCRKYGIPLLVDNAHGAYLAFLKDSCHPLALGAAMCCDSAHKTLPVLTGGAYLHVSKEYAEFSADDIRNTMALFASTSPSYLTLQSLDLCNAYIANGYQARLESLIKKLSTLRDALAGLGFSPVRSEELKIVFAQKDCGYSGYELARILSDFGIEPEFADRDFLVLMVTPENTDSDLERVYSAFASLERRTSSTDEPSLLPCTPVSALSIREAVFSSSETVNVEDSEGRICASPTVSCPPAVPIAVSGEMIDKAAIDMFKYYGIEKIEVLK